VYGIPFQAFPVKGERRSGPTEVKPQTLVQPLRERRQFELRFPRVVGYISDARFRITGDIDALPRLEITPTGDPTWVKVGQRGAGHGAIQERRAFYEAHRLHRTIFEIAAKITDDLRFGDPDGRRIMFPQVATMVRRYVETRLDCVGGAQPEEIALPRYRSIIESRVSDAIRPAKEEGEQPMLPVLDDLAGIGSTEVAPFMTTRTSAPTIRSHLSHAVTDSGWERTVARALDESPRVRAWVKNYRLGFEIPYRHGGVPHQFTPDFLAEVASTELDGGVEHLVIEVKGLEREQDRSKDAGAARWIAAVNHWGKLGTWRYAKVRRQHDLHQVLEVDTDSYDSAPQDSESG
jgi:type III restriction enzyme